MAGFGRRIGATGYEAVLLAAILIAVGFALLPFVTPPADTATVASSPPTLYLMSPRARALSAAVMLAAAAVYCVGLWSGGRRTLAMRTWRLALTTQDRNDVGVIRALIRFAACFAGPAAAVIAYIALQPSGQGRWAAALLGMNYAWAIADREGQFLQDRIARTRLVLRP
jgi:uncharacterized RDD family membrane protein YckC